MATAWVSIRSTSSSWRSKRYGFQLRSDDEHNVRIFSSLASLADHIAAQRSAA